MKNKMKQDKTKNSYGTVVLQPYGTVVLQPMNLICPLVSEKMATSVFAWERWPWLCLSPDVQFANKKFCQILLFMNQTANTSVCESRYLKID